MSSTSPSPTSSPSQTGSASSSSSSSTSRTSTTALSTTTSLPVNDAPVTTPSTVVTSMPASNASGPQPSSRTGSPVGLIVGLVLGLVVLMALILFLVRRHFINQRTQKMTAARSRMSRPGGASGLVISGPTNFKHVGSGAMNLEGNGNPATNDRSINLAANLEAAVADSEAEVEGSQDDHRKEGIVWQDENRPSNRFKQKYPPNINAVESGLYDHLEVVKSQHVPVRRI